MAADAPWPGPRTIFHASDGSLNPRAVDLAEMVALQDSCSARVAEIALKRDQLTRVDRRDIGALGLALGMMEEILALQVEAAAAVRDVNAARARVKEFDAAVAEEIVLLRSEYSERAAHDPKAGKLYPVEISGSLEKGAKLGYFKTPLPDGTFGYLQRRPDDCLQAAIASVTGAPMHMVPDLNLAKLIRIGKDPDEINLINGRKLFKWFAAGGYEVRAFPARLPTTSRRWIGLIDGDNDLPGSGHCLVMNGRDVVFDTACLFPPGDDEPKSWHSLDDISVGITIE